MCQNNKGSIATISRRAAVKKTKLFNFKADTFFRDGHVKKKVCKSLTNDCVYANREGTSPCFYVYEENSLQGVRGSSRLRRDCWS